MSRSPNRYGDTNHQRNADIYYILLFFLVVKVGWRLERKVERPVVPSVSNVM